jgi:hypothetical protein
LQSVKTRRRVAEWHCRWLFGLEGSNGRVDSAAEVRIPDHGASAKVDYRNALHHISDSLESLNLITSNASSTSIASPLPSIQSFFLALNPQDPQDEGFLGGSILGREFWRGLKGGGTGGARAFKLFCHTSSFAPKAPSIQASTPDATSLEDEHGAEDGPAVPAASTSAAFKRTPAIALKAELYATVRDALRYAFLTSVSCHLLHSFLLYLIERHQATALQR